MKLKGNLGFRIGGPKIVQFRTGQELAGTGALVYEGEVIHLEEKETRAWEQSQRFFFPVMTVAETIAHPVKAFQRAFTK